MPVLARRAGHVGPVVRIALVLMGTLAAASAVADLETKRSGERVDGSLGAASLSRGSSASSSSSGATAAAPGGVRRPRNLDAALRSVGSGTLLLQPRGSNLLEPGPVVETDVEITVTGLLARVRVQQRFSNPGERWAEGVYVFPLPDDAAVDQIRLWVDGRVLEGEVREKEVARREYKAARQAGRRTTLLEQQRPNVFTSFVANIEPGGEIAIEIEYQQSVHLDGGELSLRFPTVVAPRHERGREASDGSQESLLQLPLRPTGAGPGNPLRLHVDLAPGFELAEVTSPYHRVEVTHVGDRTIVELADGATPADRDFELRWSPTPSELPQAALFTEEFDGAHYALVMLMPPAAAAPASVPRELIFVLDTSGSMEGSSLVQARGAIERALGRLAPEDRFDVIAFDDGQSRLFGKARSATRSNVEQAQRWLGRLSAGGGTDIESALARALEDDAQAGWLRQVVFLTDGAIADEAGALSQVRARLGATRIFAVGIGSAPNGYFMRKLAELGRGSFTQIGKSEEIAEKMERLFSKLDSLVLTDLELVTERGVRISAYPKPLPDLYAGEPLVVALRSRDPIGWLGVRGLRGGQTWEASIGQRDGEQRDGVHVLWARRKIDALMHRRRPGSGAAARDSLERRRRSVIEVALAHHLVSAYTSLVVVDRTPVRRDGDPLDSHAIRPNLPAGWDRATFGLAAGATGAGLYQIVGATLLLVGAVTSARRSHPR